MSITYEDLCECEERVIEAEIALNRHKRFMLALGWREHPFASCCAEGGGSIGGCDCVNTDHGFAFRQVSAATLTLTAPPQP